MVRAWLPTTLVLNQRRSSVSSPSSLVVAIDGPSGSGKSTVARRVADALGLRYQCLDLAGLDVLDRTRRTAEQDLHLSAEQIGQGGCDPAIGHMGHAHAGHHVEQLAGNVLRRPDPGRGHADGSGVGLGVSDELGDGLGRERRVHRHDVGHPANTADGSDVAAEIKAELVVERCIDGIRDRDEQQRVAVGRSIHHRCGSNIAGRSGAVLDHEALPEPLRQPLSDQSAEDVIAATRRIANDDAHRSRRIGLRPRETRHSRQRGSARGQLQKLSTAGKFHF